MQHWDTNHNKISGTITNLNNIQILLIPKLVEENDIFVFLTCPLPLLPFIIIPEIYNYIATRLKLTLIPSMSLPVLCAEAVLSLFLSLHSAINHGYSPVEMLWLVLDQLSVFNINISQNSPFLSCISTGVIYTMYMLTFSKAMFLLPV